MATWNLFLAWLLGSETRKIIDLVLDHHCQAKANALRVFKLRPMGGPRTTRDPCCSCTGSNPISWSSQGTTSTCQTMCSCLLSLHPSQANPFVLEWLSFGLNFIIGFPQPSNGSVLGVKTLTGALHPLSTPP